MHLNSVTQHEYYTVSILWLTQNTVVSTILYYDNIIKLKFK